MATEDLDRMALARRSLDGLSVGDSLGEQFFFLPSKARMDLHGGWTPAPPWNWTDDTEMAAGIVAQLSESAIVDQDELAARFAARCDPSRGYGPGAFAVLRRIRQGVGWRQAASEAFDGSGSMGNGAAMRVAPLGAYFAGEPDRAASQATASAEVTHVHPQGVQGRPRRCDDKSCQRPNSSMWSWITSPGRSRRASGQRGHLCRSPLSKSPADWGTVRA